MLLFSFTSGFTRVGVRWLVLLVVIAYRPFWSVLLGTRQIPAWYCIMGLGPPVLGGGRSFVFDAAFELLFVAAFRDWVN